MELPLRSIRTLQSFCCWLPATSRRFNCVHCAFSVLLRRSATALSLHSHCDSPTRSFALLNGVLVSDCLRSRSASTVYKYTALSWRSHSVVVELTVMIWRPYGDTTSLLSERWGKAFVLFMFRTNAVVLRSVTFYAISPRWHCDISALLRLCCALTLAC